MIIIYVTEMIMLSGNMISGNILIRISILFYLSIILTKYLIANRLKIEQYLLIYRPHEAKNF